MMRMVRRMAVVIAIMTMDCVVVLLDNGTRREFCGGISILGGGGYG